MKPGTRSQVCVRPSGLVEIDTALVTLVARVTVRGRRLSLTLQPRVKAARLKGTYVRA